MATMPGQNEDPKPSTQPPEAKNVESTKHQFPVGHQSPGTPPGTTEYETEEPKRRAADPTTGKKPERSPEHQPGYEAKHQKEAQQKGKSASANERSQADDSAAKIDADRDKDALHDQKANRTTRSSAAKQHVKRMQPSKPITRSPGKVKIRKHK